MGRPKALVLGDDGEPWVARTVRVLLGAGVARVVVVLGAQADDAAGLVPRDARVTTVVAHDWADGLSASLRAGLAAMTGTGDPEHDERGADGTGAAGAEAVVVVPVDLPGLPVTVVRRLVAAPVHADSLRQAVYAGRPGHPVLLGRAHWSAVAAQVHGDRGARGYLVAHGGTIVECGDLFDGQDVDGPEG